MIKIIIILITISFLMGIAFLIYFGKFLHDEYKKDYANCKNCFYLARDEDGIPYCIKRLEIICKNDNYKFKKEV